MTKEDKAFEKWLEKNELLVDKLLSKEDFRPIFDSAYDMGWLDCYDELQENTD